MTKLSLIQMYVKYDFILDYSLLAEYWEIILILKPPKMDGCAEIDVSVVDLCELIDKCFPGNKINWSY